MSSNSSNSYSSDRSKDSESSSGSRIKKKLKKKNEISPSVSEISSSTSQEKEKNVKVKAKDIKGKLGIGKNKGQNSFISINLIPKPLQLEQKLKKIGKVNADMDDVTNSLAFLKVKENKNTKNRFYTNTNTNATNNINTNIYDITNKYDHLINDDFDYSKHKFVEDSNKKNIKQRFHPMLTKGVAGIMGKDGIDSLINDLNNHTSNFNISNLKSEVKIEAERNLNSKINNDQNLNQKIKDKDKDYVITNYDIPSIYRNSSSKLTILNNQSKLEVIKNENFYIKNNPSTTALNINNNAHNLNQLKYHYDGQDGHKIQYNQNNKNIPIKTDTLSKMSKLSKDVSHTSKLSQFNKQEDAEINLESKPFELINKEFNQQDNN